LQIFYNEDCYAYTHIRKNKKTKNAKMQKYVSLKLIKLIKFVGVEFKL